MSFSIEKNSRLSTSCLWELQRKAYTQFGLQAWNTKKVPTYLTSSPFMADRYAQLVLAFIKEGLSPHATLPINPLHSLYLLDLGAGTGRFGYLFLKKLVSFLEQAGISLPLRYVMTDIVPENLEYILQHECLQPYVKAGMVDCCHYSHDQEELSLKLLRSGRILSPDTIKNPLVLIANYFFDTIPHDLFRVKEHRLEEGRVSINYNPSDNIALRPEDPLIIPHLQLETSFAPVQKLHDEYLKISGLAEILDGYAIHYQNLPQILLPLGAFQVIEYFYRFSQGRFFLLAGDQGIHSDSQLMEEHSFFAQHDSFSIQVNYHAISKYFQRKEALFLATPNKDPVMVNVAAGSKGSPHSYPEVCHAFQQTLGSFEISDYFRLINDAVDMGPSITFEMILKLIKLGHADPRDMHLFYSHLLNGLSKAERRVQEELFDLIKQVHGNFYPLSSQEGAFIMNLGVLCFEMKRYEDALNYFQEALKLGYDDPLLFRNINAARHAIKKQS